MDGGFLSATGDGVTLAFALGAVVQSNITEGENAAQVAHGYPQVCGIF